MNEKKSISFIWIRAPPHAVFGQCAQAQKPYNPCQRMAAHTLSRTLLIRRAFIYNQIKVEQN